MDFVKRYRKFFIAAAAGAAVLATALADDSIDAAEVIQIAAAILGPFGVAMIPNKITPDQVTEDTRIEHVGP